MKAGINCDMGEGAGNDDLIMPYIHSANIACGYHAGDAATIQATIELCIKYHVAIGAHPSYYDRENFGRKEIQLPAQELYELVTQQLVILFEAAAACGAGMDHVKPHGALYNMSARDTSIAQTIAQAVKDFDHRLILYGLSGSHSIKEAEMLGLRTASEVFADRSYRDDGLLTPRSQPGAVLEDSAKVVQQVLQMVNTGTVKTITGKRIPVKADTICIHGDGEQAAKFAKAIHEALNTISDV